MNPSNPALSSAQSRECWLPTLQLAMQEVFELMLACPLEVPVEPPLEEGLDITSMVGLAGQLCGILTVRCDCKREVGSAHGFADAGNRRGDGRTGDVGCSRRDLQHGRGQLQEQDRRARRWLYVVRADRDYGDRI